jgi:hypothetical protein
MVRILFFIVLLNLCAVSAFGQQADTTAAAVKQQADTTATAVKQQADTTATAVKQQVAPAAVVAPPQTQLQTTPPKTAPPPATPPTTTPPPTAAPQAAQPGPKKVYYGGTVGLSFGDYFRFSIVPFVGYKLTPKLHIGGKVGYEYIEDDRYDETLTSHNYGGSVFSRVFPRPSIYGHAEYAYMSYKYKVSEAESDRFWVPFLYLGGGLVKSMGRTSVFVEVLFDVLQDDKSPYEDWAPFISVGVGVGF